MQTETAIHSGRDSLGRVLTPGRYVQCLRGREDAVLIEQDPASDDLVVRLAGMPDRVARLDEIDPRIVFSRLENLTEPPRSPGHSNIGAMLTLARSYRDQLDRLEDSIANELGCTRGDGSTLSDAVMAAVRDGMGTAVDLLDLAGALRR